MKTLTWPRAVRVLLLSSMGLAISVLGFNCSNFKATSKVGSADSSSLDSGAISEPPVAMLSSDQMLKSMIAATGVQSLGDLSSSADANIAATFTERSGSLPSVNSLTSATGPTLIAVANLASRICDKAVAQDVAVSEGSRDTRLFFREMDFSKGLSAQSSDGVVGAVTRLARNSWRREPTADEINDFVTFAQQFSQGVSASDSAQTRLLAVSVCASVLSSVDGFTY